MLGDAAGVERKAIWQNVPAVDEVGSDQGGIYDRARLLPCVPALALGKPAPWLPSEISAAA